MYRAYYRKLGLFYVKEKMRIILNTSSSRMHMVPAAGAQGYGAKLEDHQSLKFFTIQKFYGVGLCEAGASESTQESSKIQILCPG